MKEIKVTRDVFLWCMSVVYLSAFSSLYHQIPGLYGDNGILPARAIIPLTAKAEVLNKKVGETLSFLWLAPTLGLDVQLMMDLLAFLGIIISLGCIIWGRMRDMTNFTLLWMLYFSLYQVGQTFMWFQWDILLLEVGFLTILVAPLGLLHHVVHGRLLPSLPHRPHDTITLFLVRWLLFRFMFASGVVKLTSMCPTWWGLTALNYHFESQCIPTPLAWYAHHLPKWLLRLGVINTYVVEIGIPFLFFVPIRSVKMLACFTQILFQISIMLTGNYNFFNFLTITMCVSLLDDDFFLGYVRRFRAASKNINDPGSRYRNIILCTAGEFVALVAIAYWSVYFFALKIKPDWTVESKIAFSPAEFRTALSRIMPVTITIGVISLAVNIILAFYRSLTENGAVGKLWGLFGTFCISCAAIWIFIISLVPHASLETNMQRNLWPVINDWYAAVDRYQLTNAYGLFRRMTGTDDRPELIIEGSNSLTSGWKEYHFLYKPGDITKRPSYLIPHQARLDWQMWFAALSSFEHNPWFLSFIYRLLEGKKEVLQLLDTERLPFPIGDPPKYVRATLYKYSYTPFRSPRPNADWWIRKREAEYFNSSKFDRKQIVDYLKSIGILQERNIVVENGFLKRVLTNIRYYAESLSPTTFIWSLLCAAWTIPILTKILKFR